MTGGMRSFSIIPQIFNLISTTYFQSTLRYQKTKGSCSIPFALREKQKNQVSNVRVKSKIVTFGSQRIIEFKQFLTRPNLASSVAKTDRRFFRF